MPDLSSAKGLDNGSDLTKPYAFLQLLKWDTLTEYGRAEMSCHLPGGSTVLLTRDLSMVDPNLGHHGQHISLSH